MFIRLPIHLCCFDGLLFEILEILRFPSGADHLFDVVTTIFCLEYASNNSEEYQIAVRNVTELIRPGGYFVMGGVLEETWYQFGGKRYSCHYLTEEDMLKTLKSNKIDIDDEKTFKYFNHEGIFLIVGRKLS